LSAIVYIADMKRKGEMNRAWDEWVDTNNPPMRACIGVELEPPHIVEIVGDGGEVTIRFSLRSCPRKRASSSWPWVPAFRLR
jgi:hypothetical protein